MQHAGELAELQEPKSGIVSTGMQRDGDCSTEYQDESGRSIAVSWSYHQNQGHTSVETMDTTYVYEVPKVPVESIITGSTPLLRQRSENPKSERLNDDVGRMNGGEGIKSQIKSGMTRKDFGRVARAREAALFRQ